MKKIGLIGGLSFGSTSEYYTSIMRLSNSYLGGYQTAELVMVSINPNEIIHAVQGNDWNKAASILISAAKELEVMGASCIVLPCNTLHYLADIIQDAITIPILNIIDCVGRYIEQESFHRIALLGSNFTMENDFYHKKLKNKYQIEVVMPDENTRNRLHHIIFKELCFGKLMDESKNYVIRLCNTLFQNNYCDGIVLGCTELPLLVKQNDVLPSLIDTIQLHVTEAIQFILDKKSEHIKVA